MDAFLRRFATVRLSKDEDWSAKSQKHRQKAHATSSMSRADFLKFISTTMRSGGALDIDKAPEGVMAELHAFQVEGLEWLVNSYMKGTNVILGDEMGLGKTLQSISLVHYLRTVTDVVDRRPFLVVCPLSLVQTWCDEFKKFAPTTKVLRYIGSKTERESIRIHVCKQLIGEDPKSKSLPLGSYHVVVTTAESVMSDESFLAAFTYRLMIVDEAHCLKNSKRKLYQILLDRYSSTTRRLLLTGTPVQNNMTELWSLLHFIHPEIFADQEAFIRWFPEDAMVAQGSSSAKRQMQDDLTEVLSYFFLRRLKADVLKGQLPSKEEYIVYVPLTHLQRDVYQRVLLKDAASLMDGRQGALQNIIMQLRKCCNHPYLFDRVEPEPFKLGEHLILNSSKLIVLDKLLKKVKGEGGKVLVFCQFTSMMDILQDFLDLREYKYERLDGSVRGENRFESVQKFQKNEGVFVFLLSTRAGGVGLTLTAANTVVFFDSDWNPQMDLQAQERAHRIGQDKEVTIYRLLCADTVEDVILKRALKKLQLTKAVLKGEGLSSSEPATNLVDIIKSGVEKVLSAESESSIDKEFQQFCSSSIEDILNTKVKVSFDEVQKRTIEKAPSVYVYQGEDYSGRTTTDKKAGLGELRRIISKIQKAEPVEVAGAPLSQRVKPSQREESDGEVDMERHQDTREDKEKRRIERMKTKWEKSVYKTTSLPTASSAELIAPADTSTRIHNVKGDVTNPIRKKEDGVRYIVMCVNNSGNWGSGGMFGVLERLSPSIRQSYIAAKENSDLRLGDAHIIEVSESLYVILVIAQRSSTSSSQTPGGRIDTNLLDLSFSRIAALLHREEPALDPALSATVSTDLVECLQAPAEAPLQCSKHTLHFPRFGDAGEWYGVEKLMKKYFWGLDCFVYYYSRKRPRTPPRMDVDNDNDDRSAKRRPDPIEVKSPSSLTRMHTEIIETPVSLNSGNELSSGSFVARTSSAPVAAPPSRKTESHLFDGMQFEFSPDLSLTDTREGRRSALLGGGTLLEGPSDALTGVQPVIVIPDMCPPYSSWATQRIKSGAMAVEPTWFDAKKKALARVLG